jgi:hypothetical protein
MLTISNCFPTRYCGFDSFLDGGTGPGIGRLSLVFVESTRPSMKDQVRFRDFREKFHENRRKVDKKTKMRTVVIYDSR